MKMEQADNKISMAQREQFLALNEKNSEAAADLNALSFQCELNMN